MYKRQTNLTIYNGAQLTTTSGPCTVAGALLVKKGGTMNMGNLLNINGSLEVEDSATFIYAYTNSSSRSTCLLYTSDAADDLLCVDLGGRRIIKKKKYNIQKLRILI